MNKILFVATIPEFFISHRLKLAILAQNMGMSVHVVTSNGTVVNRITELGFTHHVVPFSRSGQKPFIEILTILKLFIVYLKVRPNLVYLIGNKCNIYGGVIARTLGIKAVIIAVTGLGTVFLRNNFLANLRKSLVLSTYNYIFKHKNIKVIFQNKDDIIEFSKLRNLTNEKMILIRGSGVDVSHFSYCDEPPGAPVILFAARLIKDKGVCEFVDAGVKLKERGISVTLRLVGDLDPDNLSSIKPCELEKWRSSGKLEIVGFSKNIVAEYHKANVVCLPSYREGLPLNLIEAASCGRAIVTTDVPGCREVIIDGKTGLLVPKNNVPALTDAFEMLVKQPDLRRQFGKAGRKLAQADYSNEKILAQIQEVYIDLLS